jgi:hypothetical protein
MHNQEKPEDVSFFVDTGLGTEGRAAEDEHGNRLEDEETRSGGGPDEVAVDTVHLGFCVCVCVCGNGRGREGERECVACQLCVCVYVCVCA